MVLLDNATYHQNFTLKRVKSVFLLKRSTQLTQPLDMGIIDCFKTIYEEKLLEELTRRGENNEKRVDDLLKEFDLKARIELMSECWNEIPKEFICQCLNKAGIQSLLKCEDYK